MDSEAKFVISLIAMIAVVFIFMFFYLGYADNQKTKCINSMAVNKYTINEIERVCK